MPTVTKATSRKRGIAKITKAAQKTPLPGDQVTEQVPSEGPIKRGTPAHLKVKQFDPKASAKQDAQAKSEPSKVDSKVAKAIGERVLALRKEYTRGVVAAAAGTTPSVVWRWEQGRPKVDELPAIEALFAKVDAGEIEKPQRKAFGKVQGGPTKADLVSTIEQVRHILSDVPATGLKVGQAREAISTCLDLIEKTMSSGDE